MNETRIEDAKPQHSQVQSDDPLADYRLHRPAARVADSSTTAAKPETYSPAYVGSTIDNSAKFNSYEGTQTLVSRAVQEAYDRGGMNYAQKYVDDVNDATKTSGIGPMLINDGDRLKVHLVEQLKSPPSDEQLASGAYFKHGRSYYHDLAAPTEIKTRTEKQVQDDAAKAVTELLNDSSFQQNGKLSKDAQLKLVSSLHSHRSNPQEFIDSLNKELVAQGSKYRVAADVSYNQPGWHGNTVIRYHATISDHNSGTISDEFSMGFDTVR